MAGQCDFFKDFKRHVKWPVKVRVHAFLVKICLNHFQ